MPQSTETLTISNTQGWSTTRRSTSVRLIDLARLVVSMRAQARSCAQYRWRLQARIGRPVWPTSGRATGERCLP